MWEMEDIIQVAPSSAPKCAAELPTQLALSTVRNWSAMCRPPEMYTQIAPISAVKSVVAMAIQINLAMTNASMSVRAFRGLLLIVFVYCNGRTSILQCTIKSNVLSLIFITKNINSIKSIIPLLHFILFYTF